MHHATALLLLLAPTREKCGQEQGRNFFPALFPLFPAGEQGRQQERMHHTASLFATAGEQGRQQEWMRSDTLLLALVAAGE
jgi:hypothetical protein